MRPDATPTLVLISAEQRAAVHRAAAAAREWLRARSAPVPASADRAAGAGADHAPGVLLAGAARDTAQLAAQQLANELGCDLYRLELAAIVSKYSGETEKNLERVLETAERTGAVLFFDESDALFGERTDVPDAHDRYANLDTAYLLQRLGAFPGLAVVACRQQVAQLGAGASAFGCVVELQQP